MLDIHCYSDAQTAARMATEAVNESLASHMHVPVLFLVSGGSSLRLLDGIKTEVLDGRITMGVLDERFSTDPSINNYAQLSKTDFFRIACSRGVNCIETLPKEKESIDELAKRFDTGLKQWAMSHTDGVTIALQGIGPDGHTAGIMPYPDDERSFQFLFEDEDLWVTGYDAGSRNQYPLRVTVTLPFLRKVTTSIIYAVGSEKKSALTSTLVPEGALYKIPARIIDHMPHCLLYTDQAIDTVKI